MPIREHSRIIDTKKSSLLLFLFTQMAERGCNNMSDEKFKIPQSEIDSLARMLLPKIQEYFSTEKGVPPRLHPRRPVIRLQKLQQRSHLAIRLTRSRTPSPEKPTQALSRCSTTALSRFRDCRSINSLLQNVH